MKNEHNPSVSVAMGICYRRDDLGLLHRSISSILNQTYSDFELLICDDGSTLDAVNVIESYAMKDRRIKLIRSGDCLDLAPKLNACIRNSNGEFIARMADDDYSVPERFGKQIEFLKEHKDIAFVGCDVRIYRDGEIVGERKLPEYPTVSDFFIVQPFIHPTLLFRKNALTDIGGYSEDRHQILCEDYDLLLRLYKNGYKGANMKDELLDYTVPQSAKDNRKMSHRWNETVTRMSRFRELGVLPYAFPFILKPLVVAFVPEPILARIKKCKLEQKQRV